MSTAVANGSGSASTAGSQPVVQQQQQDNEDGVDYGDDNDNDMNDEDRVRAPFSPMLAARLFSIADPVHGLPAHAGTGSNESQSQGDGGGSCKAERDAGGGGCPLAMLTSS